MIAIVGERLPQRAVRQCEEGAGGRHDEAAGRQHAARVRARRVAVGSRRLAPRLVIENGTRQRPAVEHGGAEAVPVRGRHLNEGGDDGEVHVHRDAEHER